MATPELDPGASINYRPTLTVGASVLAIDTHGKAQAEGSFEAAALANTEKNNAYGRAVGVGVGLLTIGDLAVVSPAEINKSPVDVKVVIPPPDATAVRLAAFAANNNQSNIDATSAKARRDALERQPDSKSPLPDVKLTYTYSSNDEDLKRQAKQAQLNPNVLGTSIDLSNGIQPKPDLRATLQLHPQTTPATIITDFFITDVQEEVAEKFQIVETFSTNFIFFFGQRPRIYAISGILYNSSDKQWKNSMKSIYDQTLRGTELTRYKKRAILTYDDVLREGYLLNFRHSISAQSPNVCPFSFSFYVTKEISLVPVKAIKK